jgi:hypothetical protein
MEQSLLQDAREEDSSIEEEEKEGEARKANNSSKNLEGKKKEKKKAGSKSRYQPKARPSYFGKRKGHGHEDPKKGPNSGGVGKKSSKRNETNVRQTDSSARKKKHGQKHSKDKDNFYRKQERPVVGWYLLGRNLRGHLAHCLTKYPFQNTALMVQKLDDLARLVGCLNRLISSKTKKPKPGKKIKTEEHLEKWKMLAKSVSEIDEKLHSEPETTAPVGGKGTTSHSKVSAGGAGDEEDSMTSSYPSGLPFQLSNEALDKTSMALGRTVERCLEGAKMCTSSRKAQTTTVLDLYQSAATSNIDFK